MHIYVLYLCHLKKQKQTYLWPHIPFHHCPISVLSLTTKPTEMVSRVTSSYSHLLFTPQTQVCFSFQYFTDSFPPKVTSHFLLLIWWKCFMQCMIWSSPWIVDQSFIEIASSLGLPGTMLSCFSPPTEMLIICHSSENPWNIGGPQVFSPRLSILLLVQRHIGTTIPLFPKLQTGSYHHPFHLLQSGLPSWAKEANGFLWQSLRPLCLLRRSTCLVSLSAIAILKFFIFEQKASHFHFALSPANYITRLAYPLYIQSLIDSTC